MASDTLTIDNLNLTPGVPNRITGWALSTGDNYIPAVEVEGPGVVWVGVASDPEWQRFDVIATPTGTRLRLRSDAAVFDWLNQVFFDDIEVTLVNTTLTKDLSVPYAGLQSLKSDGGPNLLADGDMEIDGIDGWATLDGVTWTSRTNPVDNAWVSVAYGNCLFVACSSTGSGNRIMTSPDGITWTIRVSAANNAWQSIAYGNGLFVAVANGGTDNRVMTSPDGIAWTIRTSAANNSWFGVAYGNGLFVAVATSGTGNRVMTSPDGTTWTIRTSAADNAWQSVAYGGGLFVAVATTDTGAGRVMTSPDGITWTSRAAAVANNWHSVTYGNGLFVAVATSGTGNRVMTSPDGTTWTIRTSAADNSWLGVAHGGGLFVAVANTGNHLMTSPDGITWTSRTAAAALGWFGVAYGNGVFAAVSVSGTNNRVMTTGGDVTKVTNDPVGGLRCLKATSTASQTILTVGEKYRALGFAASDDGVNIPTLTDGTTTWWTGTISEDWQPVFVEFIATDTDLTLNTGLWDNMSAISIVNGWMDGYYLQAFLSTYNVPANAITSLQTSGGDRTPQVFWITAFSAAIAYVSQPNAVGEVSKPFRVQGRVKSADGAGIPSVWNGLGTDLVWTGTASTDWQDIDAEFSSASTVLAIGMASPADGDRIILDYLFVAPADVDENQPPHAYREQTIGMGYRFYGWYYGDGQAVPLIKDGDVTVFTGVASVGWTFFDEFYFAQSTVLSLTQDGPSGFVKYDNLTLLEYA